MRLVLVRNLFSLFLLVIPLSGFATAADSNAGRGSLILEFGEKSEVGEHVVFSKPGRYHSYECPIFLVSVDSDLDAVCRALGKGRALAFSPRGEWNWFSKCPTEPRSSLVVDSSGHVVGMKRDLGKSEYIDSVTCD